MFSSLFDAVVQYIDDAETALTEFWSSDTVKTYRKDIVVLARDVSDGVMDFCDDHGITAFFAELELRASMLSDALPVNVMWFVPGIVAYLSPFSALTMVLAPTTFFQVLVVIGFVFYLYKLNQQMTTSHRSLDTVEITT